MKTKAITKNKSNYLLPTRNTLHRQRQACTQSERMYINIPNKWYQKAFRNAAHIPTNMPSQKSHKRNEEDPHIDKGNDQ